MTDKPVDSIATLEMRAIRSVLLALNKLPNDGSRHRVLAFVNRPAEPATAGQPTKPR